MPWSNGFLPCTDLRLLDARLFRHVANGRRVYRLRRAPDGQWLLRQADCWRLARLDAGWQCGDSYGLRWRLLPSGDCVDTVAWLGGLAPELRRRWRVLLRYGCGIA